MFSANLRGPLSDEDISVLNIIQDVEEPVIAPSQQANQVAPAEVPVKPAQAMPPAATSSGIPLAVDPVSDAADVPRIFEPISVAGTSSSGGPAVLYKEVAKERSRLANKRPNSVIDLTTNEFESITKKRAKKNDSE